MSLSKLEKFEAIHDMPIVYQNHDFKNPQLIHLRKPIDVKGKWHSAVFKNDHPIILELACGRGEYSVALAKRHPERNYLGVDIKGNRIFTGAKEALDASLTNIAFLRTRIEQLHHFIDKNEVSEVWITFPDPFSRFPDRKNRLIAPRFLDYYQATFSDIPIKYHLKTDNLRLIRYATGVLDGRGMKIDQCIENLYGIDKVVSDDLKIETYFEKLHKSQGSAIHYLGWTM